ncbi:hypothetical protein C8R43DRAFT_1085164 [Mycena crocata]|nr:hypothetical protein C8R43DRAFT_1085164 [Mycena crocata]
MSLLRFAPSPTGALHLGGLRMALYNHLYAKKHGGKWILRIEDTDSTRYVPGAVDGIRHALEWAGLEYDYGPGKGGPHAPYFQSDRLDLYRSYTTKLLSSGHAYRCFCSMDTLTELREKLARSGSSQSYDKRCLHLTEEEVARRVRAGERHIVRFNTSIPTPRRPTEDLVFGHLRDAHGSLSTDPVLLKSDGYPTYHLANVVDDHSMGITHVLRGEEWITSLPLHLDMYSALGLQPPQFGHVPILLNADGTKMSKRNGDVKVEDYISRGWERAAVLNWLALAGWGTQHECEGETRLVATDTPAPSSENHDTARILKAAPESTKVMNMDELISEFDVSALTHRSATLDPLKLVYLNRQHILHSTSTEAGLQDVLTHSSDEFVTPEYIQSVIHLLDARLTNVHEVVTIAPYCFWEPQYNTPEAERMLRRVGIEQRDQILGDLVSLLEKTDLPVWADAAVLTDQMHKEMDRTELPVGIFMPVVRHALTATKDGPPVAELMVVLGRARTLARIKARISAS